MNYLGKGLFDIIYGVFNGDIHDFLGACGCRTDHDGRVCGGSGSGSSIEMV